MKRITFSPSDLAPWVAIVFLLFLFLSCSRLGDVVGPQLSQFDETQEAFQPVIYDYPEAADYPPEGYQIINLYGDESSGHTDDGSSSFEDDYDTSWVYNENRSAYFGVSKFIESGEEESVSWRRGSVSFTGNALPSGSRWISMICRLPREPWIDFSPHGLVFNQPVTIRISYADGILPYGVRPENLVLFYWNETTGEYEFISMNNNAREQYIEGHTDHFSRYIIAVAR